MRKLTIKKIFEFYDVPQLFVATDALGINYVCVLYNSNSVYEYLAVQVSDLRMNAYVSGELDLRKLYTSPEQDNTLYHVVVKNKTATADKLLQPSDITEDMLPEAGFYYDATDAIEDSNADVIQIDIPVKDRSFFADIANRMGWTTKMLSGAVRKIAIF